MPLLYHVQNTTIGIVLISTVLYYVLGLAGKRQPLESLFVYLLFSVLVLLILKQWMYILEGRTFQGSRVGAITLSFLYYLLMPLPGVLYVLYIDQLHNKWVVIPVKIGLIVAIPMHLNAIFLTISLFKGMIFSVDASNVVHRGDYFLVVAMCTGIYLVAGQVYAFILYSRRNRQTIPHIILFPYLVVVAAILQFLFEHLELYLVALAITLLQAYLRIQNTQANRDFLTSLYNRSIGEAYLTYQFANSSKKKLIGGMLMDIDGFKRVNDEYGHDLGDICLRSFSQLLTESFSRSWLICRYGGDEFLLIRLLDTASELDQDIKMFKKNLDYFNILGKLPFFLEISIGKGIADEHEACDAASFLKLLDGRMYQDKAEHHADDKQGFKQSVLPLL